ncbi:uncharacterized protein [Eleutherodactylus coqui]|uniref:uncharacterized protein n=1 Tax=Eleutherodactylus coqui TaxID=57060 RepID=UPI0034619815
METEESQGNIQDNQNNNLEAEEMMQRKRKREVNQEKQRENIVKSGNVFIVTFMNLLQKTQDRKEVACHYMERVLHSIFFFGHINRPPISPAEFIPEQQMKQFKTIFPKPFREYNTHLPCYTPFSVLLEYMVGSLNPKTPDVLLKDLETDNKSLLIDDEEGNKCVANSFAATVVTYCYVKNPCAQKVLKEAYGSSMSCKGKYQRNVMINISALHVWDRAISYAVCSAGTSPPITFPVEVHCKAYKLRPKREIPPCTKCFSMYIVQFNPEYKALNRKEDWPYGNCAENEALSRLLQSHEDVGREIYIMDEDGGKLMNKEDIENRFKHVYEGEIQKHLRRRLTSRNFMLIQGEWNLFTP